ncbi:hypothetical protein K493DRAFT_392004 [Basidiobolus meristosporus CBS 931.73]|uniref:Uncharacterized protein n=1 Tax=Basidiobolus meristosporus CBS 931.73 TaxID=1314790 RepID=A0A1Y1YQH5_9FUNG|nr:hypothetical protein K493DRAFT_392004 [Basidiobolus meristosporus CBS 931.73]|eukprot:ORY00278.1 hypothetical protein K493DRAFT_392004 [Basidiobolus meristosporus CBS 931.73]
MHQSKILWMLMMLFLALHTASQSFNDGFVEDVGRRATMRREDFRPRRGSFRSVELEEEDLELDEIDDEPHNRHEEQVQPPNRRPRIDMGRNKRIDRTGPPRDRPNIREEPSSPEEEPEEANNTEEVKFVNTPIKNPKDCVILALNNGAACLDPKSFGKGKPPAPPA